MVRFSRVCLVAFPMYHPQGLRSCELTRDNGEKFLKYQEGCERTQALPLNATECVFCHVTRACQGGLFDSLHTVIDLRQKPAPKPAGQ
jgi:hypothetical protein